MENQASIQLINLAEIHGLAKAREMLGIPAPGAQPAPVAVETAPAVATETPVAAETPAQTPAPNADRAAQDEAAQNATVAELKAALDQLGISYPKTAKKADLLASFLARP